MKQSTPSLPITIESSRDLQCVGTMEIVAPKPIGFLWGSLPVLGDNSFPTFTPALLPSQDTVSAPRYQKIPLETDLNRPPLHTDFPDKALTIAPFGSRITGDISKEAHVTSKKCEALVFSGLTEYGDGIDIIAPVDILKQIFKIPYSKARVSIAVQRVGQTLVLNPGPDVEEGDKLIRRHQNQPKCTTNNVDECPPTHPPHRDGQSSSSALPPEESAPDDRLDNAAGSSKLLKHDGRICENEKIKPSGDSEKHRRCGRNEFLTVLFWQFHNFRILLGSDLLLSTNLAVNLQWWDLSEKVTPLRWLEAWLDNVMSNLPDLAICYHEKGVVQGYELLKTDDIFLLKGISEDGTPAFHPLFVQTNVQAVLRFLQSKCKQDPGVYWLYKSAGEDLIQLFDLSVIPNSDSPGDENDSASTLPSMIHSGRSDSLFSLGYLLYRVGHRLSLSVVPTDRTKCARFLRKCLNFLNEPDHMVVRAYAHEQLARLILNNDEEVDLTFESNNVQRDVKITDLEDESLDPVTVDHESEEVIFSEDKFTEDYLGSDISVPKLEADVPPCKKLSSPDILDSQDSHDAETCVSSDTNIVLRPLCQAPAPTSLISSKLAAVRHVSQAIKSLRWTRQQQSSEQDGPFDEALPPVDFSKCSCGDPDCIEVCDIQKWLPTSQLDRKLWNLVLLLGESYLSVGEAYKEGGQLHQSLNAVELACSVYGSMPHKFEETIFVSSMNKAVLLQSKSQEATDFEAELSSSARLFWSKVWMLVGDIYAEFHGPHSQWLSRRPRVTSDSQLRMPSEVRKEVARLKKKLTEYSQNCASCSLVYCSCDRASSSSSGRIMSHDRKHDRKLKSKNEGRRLSRNVEDEHVNVTFANTEVHTSAGTKEAVSLDQQNEFSSEETTGMKRGGIFKYLKGSKSDDDDAESNLLAALNCYEEARRALQELPSVCNEFQHLNRMKGWAYNELGRNRLGSKNLNRAEDAFAAAIVAFKEVHDHTNVILINCNLGYGRRALAEETVAKMEALKLRPAFKNAYEQALKTAKVEYLKSLLFYMAAKNEHSVASDSVPDAENLKVDVYTQLANTHLRFGMLLAKEDTTEHEASANIRDALALYESLGGIREQEAAYAYLQLASCQKDCCLRKLETDIQKAIRHASLADRHWQRSSDFYGPENAPSMFLTILIERSALSFSLSIFCQTDTMLETALSCLLEGRHVSETHAESIRTKEVKLYSKFWDQSRIVLKEMLTLSIRAEGANKSQRSEKLRELYKTSLKPTSLSDLNAMHALWTTRVN